MATAAVAFNAVTNEKPVEKPAPQLWFYQSNSTATADINNPANYALTKPSSSVNCGEGAIVCSIQDEADPSNSSQPAMSHGNVSSNPTSYSRNLRTPF